MSRKKIVVLGFMGACPIAGVIWQHLHYLEGLRRLGHEIYYIEDSARLPYHPVTFVTGEDASYAGAMLGRLAERFGFAENWAFSPRYAADPAAGTLGLPLAKIRELYREADVILNLCGAQELHEDLLGNERLIYVESDPGVEQIKVDQEVSGTLEYLSRHARLFTFGENVGRPEFPVPLHGLGWLPTRQPVVTDWWFSADRPPAEAVFTTVANWSTSGKKDIVWRGENYLWSKSLEFRKFSAAPLLAGESFELATNLRDAAERELFLQQNWRLTSPQALSVDYHSYRSYLQNSKGEFTVAKDQYVRLQTGWFSDRTACYLAAGRPAITQETGFSRLFGKQGGLFAFSTMEEIVEAVREIHLDYGKHCRRAHEIACEFFEADKVIQSLLTRSGV